MRKLNNFSGRLLAAFVTLVDCGQFKLAASRFHVSQSAFSQMISRLEADVGARLFNRDTRHVSLTPEGQTLLPIARAIAADVDAMYALMRDLVERRQGKVALAALPSLSSDWLPAIIAEYRRRYPGITVQFFDTVPEQNVELVRRGAVDFALNARVGNPDEFETAPLFDEPFFLVCAATHPLAGRKRVALAALTGCDYIHTSRTGSIFHWLAPFLRDLRIHDTGLEVGHLSTLAGLVAQGCGVSLVPASGLPQFLRLGLAAVPVSDRMLKRPLLVVRRRGHGLSIAAQELLALIKATPLPHPMHRPVAQPGPIASG